MKKLFFTFAAAVFLLTAATVYADSNDIAEATKVVEAGIQASKNGDIPTALSLCSIKLRTEMEGDINKYKGLKELIILVAKATDEKIESVEMAGDKVEATILSYAPNLEDLMEKSFDELMEEYFSAEIKLQNSTEKELMELLLAKTTDMFLNGDYVMYNTIHKETLIKENGVWKLDETTEPTPRQ